MDATVIVLIVVVVVALAVGGVVLARQRRSQRLREHYGEEYERSVEQTGDRKAAEAALTEREARVRELDIRDLRPEERDGFTERWAAVQRGFVDDPAGSLRQADDLVVEIMRVRGYPVEGDFDRRAEDLSVDHPQVVRHYRDARAVRDAGDADTEKQRTAVTSYRSLVEALLGKHGGDHDHDGGRHHRDDDHDGRDEHHRDRVEDAHHAPDPRTDGRSSRNGVHTDVTTTTEEQKR